VIPLTLAEVAAATGGRLDAGTDPETVISGAVTIDSRAIGAGDLFVALPGERVDGHDFAPAAVAAGAAAVLAVRPTGVPAVLVDDPVLALGRLAQAVRDRLPDLVVVGVTGSSGKTSTKDLIAAVLSRAGATVANQGSFNNEIGAPLTILKVDAGTRYLVVEMGARGVGHIAYLSDLTHPSIGVVLNVGAAHASEFGSKEATAQAKGELVEGLAPSGLAVLNADDPLVIAMALRTKARVTLTGVTEEAQVKAENISVDEEARAAFDLVVKDAAGVDHDAGVPVRVQLAVHGAHHVGNALAAAAVGLEVGLPVAEIAEALSAAGAASRWRMEVKRRSDGLVVVNDAYNANVDSMTAALRALATMASALPGESAGWAVLGEMLEIGADSAQRHAGIGRLVAELGLGGLVTVGPGAVPIADGAREAGTGVRVFSADGVDEAVALVQQNVRGGDVVLIKASRAIGLERVAAGLLAETDETERPSAAIPGSASPAQSAIPEPDAPAGPTERKEEPA
jgi:UDP-N-acetylmuramoyl-tripeptide--D-alanyl-D-alanine ligase